MAWDVSQGPQPAHQHMRNDGNCWPHGGGPVGDLFAIPFGCVYTSNLYLNHGRRMQIPPSWASPVFVDFMLSFVDKAAKILSERFRMAADPEGRPLYFANGDFAKAVADIIASPRRGKAYTNHDALYEISDRQREYYTRCFCHLMKNTQGSASTEGLLNGGDSRVVEFFKRSGLDNNSLSRIWTLSDVNEDGWLDINEFSTAMHLIVLRVKFVIGIVSMKFVVFRVELLFQCVFLNAFDHRMFRLMFRHNYSTALKRPVLLHKDVAHLAEFSDVPPLLVDSRPTAVKQTIPLLALKSPSGPPPQPPPRPQQRGHTRSASLDMMKNIQLTQTGIFLPTADRRPSDSTAAPVDSAATATSIPSAPPPPIPQRASPPAPIPRKSITAETQTDGQYVEAGDCMMIGFSGLRAQNAELEAERARMAQVRVQLELRLQEMLDGNSRGRKPTSL
ncbi:unnamed protein product [Nippostrongylus brasiliensis]|uniref:EF-hand domain-containing protein n=1 Tax=Nippostrongylus brasiliensis TaxID=27835 RepID=A0A0N4YSZ7_NIPBR|nr:unnamed protein product [Nippostrongylus brasiliensis]